MRAASVCLVLPEKKPVLCPCCGGAMEFLRMIRPPRMMFARPPPPVAA